jgi:hypothetical protein
MCDPYCCVSDEECQKKKCVVEENILYFTLFCFPQYLHVSVAYYLKSSRLVYDYPNRDMSQTMKVGNYFTKELIFPKEQMTYTDMR